MRVAQFAGCNWRGRPQGRPPGAAQLGADDPAAAVMQRRPFKPGTIWDPDRIAASFRAPPGV